MRFRKQCWKIPNESTVFGMRQWNFFGIFSNTVYEEEKKFIQMQFSALMSQVQMEKYKKNMSEYNFNIFGRIARQSHATSALNSMSNFNRMNDALNIIDSLNIGKQAHMVNILESFESDSFGLLGLPCLTRCQGFQVDCTISISIDEFARSTWKDIISKIQRIFHLNFLEF